MLLSERKTPVVIREVGPRDGFQSLGEVLPTGLKVELIRGLVGAGLAHVQAASFVHPGRVPQMADAEEVVSALVGDGCGAEFSALALNVTGVRRAAKSGLSLVEVGASASDTHSLANVGMGRDKALDAVGEMVREARSRGLAVWADIQCAFGCATEGEVPEAQVLGMAGRMLALDIDCLVLADTAGMATPRAVATLSRAVRDLAGPVPVGLHLHDTRGLGLVNLVAGLDAGVTLFDAAFGGLGGCPFVPGAAGNVSTEGAAYLMESLGFSTGVSISGVSSVSSRLEKHLGRELPGKLHRLPFFT